MEKMWEAWLNDSSEVCQVIIKCVGWVGRTKSGRIAD